MYLCLQHFTVAKPQGGEKGPETGGRRERPGRPRRGRGSWQPRFTWSCHDILVAVLILMLRWPSPRDPGGPGVWGERGEAGGRRERPGELAATVYTVLSCKHVPPLLQLPSPSLLGCLDHLHGPPATEAVPGPGRPHGRSPVSRH